jgi:hypothetical protein
VVEGNAIGDDDGGSEESEKEKPTFDQRSCFSKGCEAFIRIFKIGAACLALLNCVLDILYAYKTIYVMQKIFVVTCVMLGVRILGVFALGQYYYTVQVRRYTQAMSGTVEKKVAADDEGADYDETGKSQSSRGEAAVSQQGRRLYSSMHVLLYTGFYRILPARDFNYELGIGYTLECLTSLLPMFFC